MALRLKRAKGIVSKSRQLEERGLVWGHVFEGYFNKAGFDLPCLHPGCFDINDPKR